jgi:hypothetical protein
VPALTSDYSIVKEPSPACKFSLPHAVRQEGDRADAVIFYMSQILCF